MTVSGRTAVVTGSASGLGAAILARLAAQGWTAIGVDLREADIVADLTTETGRAAMLEGVAHLCPGGIDALVACAGVGPHLPSEVVAAVNYFGAVATLDGFLPKLEQGEHPAAVAISSNSAGIVPPDAELLEACLAGDEQRALEIAGRTDSAVVYGTSKRALAIAVRRRAEAWGERRVRLNAIAPGPMNTPLLEGVSAHPVLGPLVEALPVPLGRAAEPEEIAELAVWLIDGAPYLLHGSVLFVDGGTDAAQRPEQV